MTEQEERKNRRISWMTSFGVHGVMILLFIFVMGWTAPDPPLSEYGSGVELNFGTDDQGSGDVQTLSSAGDVPQPANEKTEEVAPKEEVKKVETQKETEKVESNLTSKDEESPVEVKETKKEVKKVDKEDSKAKDEKKTPVEGKKEDVKGKDTDGKKTTEDNSKKTGTTGQSEGDDVNKKGNKGDPAGTLDPNGQYTGKPGTGGPGSGGNGFGLQMAGWNWDELPQQPKIPDNVNGRITFEIIVDSEGEIVSIQTKERGLSPEAEKICKDEIMKRSFVPKDGFTPPAQSKGTITFFLRVR
jgi:hypothetical protein